MTREEFDEMFSKCSDDLKMKDPKEVIEKLKNYVDEGKTSISDKELAMFAYVESTMRRNCIRLAKASPPPRDAL